jgi:hypothetical protein
MLVSLAVFGSTVSAAPIHRTLLHLLQVNIHVQVLAIALVLLQYIQTSVPYQDLSQLSRALAVNELFRVIQLYVHVQIDRHEPALVLSLAPLQAHNDVLVDPRVKI